MLYNSKSLAYLSTHINEKVEKLALKKRTDPDVDYEFVFRQLAGRKRIENKIPHFFSQVELVFPPQLNIEQCSSESTALYKKSLCEGNVFIDLTGGFGVDFAFISTNFSQAFYVEQNEELCKIAAHNFDILEINNSTIIHTDAIAFIEKMPQADCVLVDPARRDKTGGKTVFLADCEPDITKLYQKILDKSKMLLVKLSPMLDITAAVQALKFVKEVHVVSVANECKEVLLVLQPSYEGNIAYYAVNILKNADIDSYSFEKEKESTSHISYSTEVLSSLYEPNSSILKAGAFKMIAVDYSVNKLHINTHLYSSDELILDFPGRIFRVKKVWKIGKKELSELKRQLTKANVSTRNFPLTTEQLKMKIGIADGGDTYLFGCTLADNSHVIIECEKVTSIV